MVKAFDPATTPATVRVLEPVAANPPPPVPKVTPRVALRVKLVVPCKVPPFKAIAVTALLTAPRFASALMESVPPSTTVALASVVVP